MSAWMKAAQLAPVIITAGAAFSLVAIKIDDPGLRRIVRVVGMILAVGSGFSVVVQVPQVLSAIEDGFESSMRILGMDEASRLRRIAREAEIETARIRAEAQAQAEVAKVEREKLMHQRKVELDRRAAEADLIKAKADAEAREDARRLAALQAKEDAAAAERRSRAAAQAERDAHFRRAEAWRAANGGCDIGYRQQCMSVGSSGGGPRQSLGCSCVPVN